MEGYDLTVSRYAPKYKVGWMDLFLGFGQLLWLVLFVAGVLTPGTDE